MCGLQTRNRGTKGIPRCQSLKSQSLKSILRLEIQQTRAHLNKVTMWPNHVGIHSGGRRSSVRISVTKVLRGRSFVALCLGLLDSWELFTE